MQQTKRRQPLRLAQKQGLSWHLHQHQQQKRRQSRLSLSLSCHAPTTKQLAKPQPTTPQQLGQSLCCRSLAIHPSYSLALLRPWPEEQLQEQLLQLTMMRRR